jgi:hypothetical protein
MAALGNCGGEAPGLLPVLVGPGVERCPVATALAESDVLFLGEIVCGPHGAGVFDGVPRYTLPPRYREACNLADGWMTEWRARPND